MPDNSEQTRCDVTSPAVQKHLEIMQDVIRRMATNSSSLKAWCVTIVSAIIVVVVSKDKPAYVSIALIPTIMFCGLDMYYLALEKRFRKAYESFVCKLHAGTLVANDMYVVKPLGKMDLLFWVGAFLSYSIWPFYLVIGIMCALTTFIFTFIFTSN